ncbi:MAG: histidine phosphatase family protein [Anaerolineales bacterium]|nr:histidine phosphatase family protein [Anaerolineales bacterium]
MLPTIYLVRHATPDWTRTDIPYHLPPGPPLTPLGEQEAAQLGEFLRDMGVRQLLASPLARCRHTAEIAAEVAGARWVEEPRLAEWQPQEKARDVHARVWPVWTGAGQVCQTTGPVALVTHGGPIGALLTQLGVDAQRLAQYQSLFDRRNPVPPAGAWRAVQAAPEAPWSLDLAFTPAASPAKAWLV